MPFIGNQPALSYTSFAKQDFTTSATTSYTLDNPVANANELALFINFVRQEPTTAYSASGTTLTLTSATSSSDDMYCVYLGKAVQTVNPPNASVGTAQLVDDAVTKDKVSNLMYPAFSVYASADLAVTTSVLTKVQMNTKILDTDSKFDNVTNYRFTPTIAGKYFITFTLCSDANAVTIIEGTRAAIYKNGSLITGTYSISDTRNNFVTGESVTTSVIVDLSVTDYIEFFGVVIFASNQSYFRGNGCMAQGYRIGD